MTLMDDATRFFYVYLIKSKDETLDYFKIYKAEVENQLERKIKSLRSDRDGDYFLILFDELSEEHSIIYENTPPYLPESIGIAVTKKRTLTDLVSAVLDTAGLSKICWSNKIAPSPPIDSFIETRDEIGLEML